MKQNYLVICTLIGCISGSSLYADALDDLVEQKQTEQLLLKQKQKAPKPNILDEIADCEQAVAKAIEKRNAISNEETYVFNPKVVGATKDGLISHMAKIPFVDDRQSKIYITDFAKQGVFIKVFNNSWKKYFIYTKDTDYVDNEEFRETNLIYKSAGNYKYIATDGSTHSVRAFKATKHNISEINPKTYLNNKELCCCQYISSNEPGFKEVGVYKDNRNFKYPVHSKFMEGKCKTRVHPNGIKGSNDSMAVFTGIYYDGK